jgi:large subunit ribosomal protein L23
VAIDASKTEIKAAVEQLFSVKVKAVNTLVRKGKVKRFRGQARRRATTSRRLIVTLVDGQSIDISTGL